MSMETEVFQVERAGGLEGDIQRNPANASKLENFLIDRQTGCWSTRLGYEPFVVGEFSSWNPFNQTGPVYGLHVAQGLGNGSRQHILFEHDGKLDLLYSAVGGLEIIRTLATGRNVPATNQAGPWFTDTAYGTVITNGVDRPVIVKPWPLGSASESSSTISQCIRPFGFDSSPRPPTPHQNIPIPTANDSSIATGGGDTSLWTLADSQAISDGGRWGLGFAKNTGDAAGKAALFGWAISMISSTGSEGPRSELQSAFWQLPAGADGYRYAITLDVPLGGPGTVARKVYRTANYSEDGAATDDTTLYLVGLIRNNVEEVFYDARQTADLGQPAPVVATGPLPAPRARFSAIFKQCLFLDGGVDDPYSLYFSSPGLIEQFDATSYISVATSGQTGGITGIYGHYNALLVFREQGIDVVQGDFSTGFTVTTYSTTVACVSPHSIVTVPGLGVVFLARDGIYAITGGFQGGAITDLVLLSGGIDELIQRITPDCLAKAVAVYSSPWREYQLYVPMDGNDRPNMGIILHTDRIGDDNSAWSTRDGFPVGSVSRMFDGTVIFGHNTGYETGNNDDQQGIFVLSGRRTLGASIDNDTYVPGDPPTSTCRSAWQDFGDARLKKQVQYVTLYVMTTGTTPTIQLRWYNDYGYEPTAERTYESQPPDRTRLPVFGKAILNAAKTNYSKERLVPLRFSVANMSCSQFMFEVVTQSDFLLFGWEIEYTSKGVTTTLGKRA